MVMIRNSKSRLHALECGECQFMSLVSYAKGSFVREMMRKSIRRKRLAMKGCGRHSSNTEMRHRSRHSPSHRRVALGPPVNKALAQLLNIEVEEAPAQQEDNKENDPDRVG